MLLNDTESQLINSALAQGMQVFQLKIGLREGTLLKSVRSYMAMKALDDLGDVIKTDPLVEDLERDNFGLEFSVILVTEAPVEKIRDTILSIAEIETVIATTVRAVNRSKTNMQKRGMCLRELPDSGRSGERAPTGNQNRTWSCTKTKGRALLRVDAEKLDALLNWLASWSSTKPVCSRLVFPTSCRN